MNADIYTLRRERVRERMRSFGLDALFVSHAANRFYLSGFELHDPQCNESAGYLLMTASGQDWLCTDMRYLDAAKRLWNPERVFIYGAKSPDMLRKFLREKAGGRIGVEFGALSAAFCRELSHGLALTDARGIVESLRIIKDGAEIAAMERSCELNHRLMEWVYHELAVGRSEAQISWSIEKYFREHGASELAFANIVAIGPNAALPHYNPGNVQLTENCPILIDVGARLDDYCSDQTRTFWVGEEVSASFMLTQQLVRTAQDAAIAAIRPGKKCSEIYKVAYDVFLDEGVEKEFTHGLGHGIGLETHEAPSLNPRCHTLLQPGMVVTVEPGLYYPQWGGVRREFMVLVEEEGCRIL